MPRTDNEVLNQTIYQVWQRQIKSPKEAEALKSWWRTLYKNEQKAEGSAAICTPFRLLFAYSRLVRLLFFAPITITTRRVCDVRTVAVAGVRTVSDEDRKFGADHVLAIPRRKCTLLHRGHCAGIRVQG